MPLTDTFKKLNNINDLPSKNDKRSLLKSYLNNTIFKKVITLLMSEELTFHTKKLPPCDSPAVAGDSTVIFDFLEKLASQRGASDKDKQHLASLAGNGPTRQVVERILKGKTEAGFSVRSVNAVCSGTIHQTPYQRCSGPKMLDRVSLQPFGIIQKKSDGMFVYASKYSTEPFVSRRGKRFNFFGELEDELAIYSERLDLEYPFPILVGELTLIEDGETMPRKKGNGIINKFIKGTGTLEQAGQVIFTVWDVLSGKDYERGESDVPYGDRWQSLVEAFSVESEGESSGYKRISLIETEEVSSLKEAHNFYQKMRGQGEEGAILKDLNALWKNNTSPLQVKMKHFAEAEFKIVDVNEGEGRLAGKMGSIRVTTDDGGIVCNVGSGFTDKERDINFWVDHLDDIVTIQFESVIEDKKRKTNKSLFLPTFVETRFGEKTLADTTKYVEDLR